MKKSFLLALFLGVTMLVSAQDHYKFIIIPTTFPGISEGIDPYGTCAAVQKELSGKDIPCFFESQDHPLDYCDGLRVTLTKGKSLLKNKVEMQMVDCMNRTVWEGEGVGMSKDFRPGYAEAIADALKDFNEIPELKYNYQQSSTTVQTVAPVAPPVAAVAQTDAASYTPQNLYYNEEYIVDYLTDSAGNRKLVIMNGEKLGYEKMEPIATLMDSDLPGIFTVSWIEPNGDEWSGVATENGEELKISVKSGEDKKTITLHKQ